MKKRLTAEQDQFLCELTLRHSDMLFKYAYRFFGYQSYFRGIAEDAVQETLIKAIEDVDALMVHPNCIAWLKVSLRYILLNIRRDPRWKSEELRDAFTDINIKSKNAVLDAFDRYEEYPRIKDIIEVADKILTPGEADTFYDHFLFGLTTEESAILEVVSKDTVRGRISRIRKKLRDHFGILCTFLFLLFYKW